MAAASPVESVPAGVSAVSGFALAMLGCLTLAGSFMAYVLVR